MNVTLTYRLDRGETTAEPQDFDAGVSDFAGLSRFGLIVAIWSEPW